MFHRFGEFNGFRARRRPASAAVAGAVAFDLTAGVPGGFTFARASGQTVRNSSGVATWLANNTYGVHYDVAGTALGYLAERAATNNIASSTALTSAAGGAITSTTAPAPNGASAANLVVEDGATSLHFATKNNTSWTAGDNNLVMVFAKAAGRRWLNLFYTSSLGNQYFDLIGGAIGRNGSAAECWIEEWADGWYRVAIRGATIDTSGEASLNLRMSPADGTGTYAGDGASGQNFWGFEQLTGWYPTSHIPTSAGAVTRAATTLSGTFTARTPTSIRVKGRTARGVQPYGDQFICTLTGNNGNNLIDVYRDHTNRHIIAYYGATSVDFGEVLDNTAFDLTAAVAGAPEVDTIHIGADALGANQWDGTIALISITDTAAVVGENALQFDGDPLQFDGEDVEFN